MHERRAPDDESSRTTVMGRRRRFWRALALLRRAAPESLRQQQLRPATADWQIYRDPLGLFRRRLPPGWMALATFQPANAQAPNPSSAILRIGVAGD
jgi:hypothetical protein